MRSRILLLVASSAILLGGTSATASWDPLQKARRAARAGAEAMAAGDTLAAIDSYLRAQALSPEDPQIRMAVGEAFYASGEFKSSLNQFKAVADPQHPALTGQSLYNAGNAAFEMGDFQQALDLYTDALLAGGAESDLLYNLELAQSILEQGQPNPDQQDPSESGEEPSEQEEQEDPSEQQPQEGEQDQQEQQEQEEREEREEREEDEEQQDESESQEQEEAPADSTETEPPPPEPAAADSTLALPEGMTPEEAMRLLEALDHDEEELRKAIQRRLRGAESASENDW